jgi:hypothetical protein
MSTQLNLIEQYKESHQQVARMLAAGMTDSMIRQRTGYSHRRLALLKGSPMFQELIETFRQRIEEKWEANVDPYLDLGMSNMIRAESMIAERLEAADDPEAEPIPIAILDKVSQGRADRFGYSKHSIIHHNHDFATALDKAIARSGVKQIEAQAEPPSHEMKLVSQLPSPEPAAKPLRERAPSFIRVLTPIKRRKIA